MTGSDHDGEVINAARLANRLVTSAGMTWPDVLKAQSVVAYQQSACSPPRSWRQVTRECLEHEAELTDWDQQFLNSILRRVSPLSAKQTAALRRIAVKLEIRLW
jgi:hypothetical protein